MELLQSYGLFLSVILNVVLFFILEAYSPQDFKFNNIILQRTWRAFLVIAVIFLFVSTWYFVVPLDYPWDKTVSIYCLTLLANIALSTIATFILKWVWKK